MAGRAPWRLLVTLWLGLAAATGSTGAAAQQVKLVNIGWHTGIAIRVSDIDPSALPEIVDVVGAPWVEFGWGDAEFYRDPDPAMSTYLSALFVATPAVMHVVDMPAEPDRYFPAAEVVDIPLDPAGFQSLVSYIAASFDGAAGRPAPVVGDGLYANSRFYDAVGTFTLQNTCNTWVARAFAAAGLPIDPEGVVRASTVTEQVRAAVAGSREPAGRQFDGNDALESR